MIPRKKHFDVKLRATSGQKMRLLIVSEQLDSVPAAAMAEVPTISSTPGWRVTSVVEINKYYRVVLA